MTGRTFAIGSRHVYGFEFFFRVVQLPAEYLNIRQVGFISGCPDSAEKRQAGKKIFDCLGIIHIAAAQKSDQLLFLKSPRFQACIKSAQARGLKMFWGGF
jgi:hypothetical protein